MATLIALEILSDIEAELGGPLTMASQLDAIRVSWFVKTAPGTGFNTSAAYRPAVYQSQGQDWDDSTARGFLPTPVSTRGGQPRGNTAQWDLESNVVFSLLTDPDARGLVFQHQGSNDNNGLSYSREAATGHTSRSSSSRPPRPSRPTPRSGCCSQPPPAGSPAVVGGASRS